MNIYDFLKVPDVHHKTTLTPLRKNILLFVLFFAVTLSLMAPLASDTHIPEFIDFKNHIAMIVQAKMALEEGQFPLRIAPYEHQFLGYPLFQFYGSLVYTLAGSIYTWLTPNNPYVAFKLTAMFTFMLAALYSFRSAFLLSRNTKISTFAALVYLCTPYFLINLEVRAAFTEFFAQGLLPVVLFYSLAVFQSPTPFRRIVLLSVAWAALAMSHLITFVYASLFMGLFFSLLALFRFQTVAPLLRLGLAYLFGVLLSLWMLAPAWHLHHYMAIDGSIHDPFYSHWLTPLSTLLSFSPTSPMPLPGNGLLKTRIYLSLGFPMLIVLALSFMRLFAFEPWSQSRKFFCVLMGVYFLALLMAWAPFDLYVFLPRPLDIAQFSYRLLSQTMWLGLIIFTVALSRVFAQEKIDGIFIVIFAAVIFLSTGPWIQAEQSSTYLIEDIVNHPVTDPNGGYLADSREYVALLENKKNTVALPPSSPLPFYGLPCSREGGKTVCEITSTGEDHLTVLPALYLPDVLKVTVDGKPFPFDRTIGYGVYVLVGVKMPKGTHQVMIEFVGLRWANWISGFAFTLVILYLLMRLSSYLLPLLKKQANVLRHRRS